MNVPFALKVFAGVVSIVYIVSFLQGYTLIRWYPLLGEASLEDLPNTAGPAMGWFSWILQSFVIGAIVAAAALFVPKNLTARIGPTISWLVPLLVSVYTVYAEWHWFVD